MPLAAGTRLGAYEILAPLGSGGMGEVYRARDHQLGREVAIKVLPSELLDTADRATRFEREARVLGSLNHPNIAHVYGFDRAGDVHYLVMELVEGVTLEAQLRNGPLAADDALAAARQIVEALDAAHASGIVHRDLKPANIKVRPDGVIKVLDFGLAKAFDDGSDANAASNSPTLMTGATRDGWILGTAAYMSPEQARGKRVDKRTDIWAFGCVVYEMLTGRQAFGGATVSDAIANVLGRDIDWGAVPVSTPPSVQRLLRRCLERDVRRRLHDIADARLDLEDRDESHSAPVAARAGTRWSLLWTAAPLLVGALLVAGLVARTWSAPPSESSTLRPQVVRFMVAVDQNAVLEPQIPAVAISADGNAIVFNARTNIADATSNHLYLRRLGDYSSTLIAGTGGGRRPAFSPDGQSIVFLRMPALEITLVALDGGAPQVVCRLANVNVTGLSWGADGTIMFAYRGISGGAALMRVNASGGEPATVAAPDSAKGELGLGWPQRLPDGDRVLYTISKKSGVDAVGVLSLKTGERREILTDARFARYLPTGHVVYVRGGNLVAQRFDVGTASVLGAAMVVIQGMVYDPASGGAHFAVAEQTGAMVYAPSVSSGVKLSMVWIDRAGATVVPALPSREYRQPSLSPDGGRVALEVTLANRDLWIYDIDREVMSPLTTTPEEEETPQWSPDGTRVAFASERDGQRGLFVMQSDGSGSEQRLWVTPDHFHVNAWSPDGKSIILNTRTASQDLSVYSFDSRTVTPFVVTPANEFGAAISRDGRWVAYVSDKSGRQETYVGPFGRPGGAVQISRDGGSEPAWAHSGREVFFRDARANQLMTVDIGPGDALRVGSPRILVNVPFAAVDRDAGYIVSQDDKRFLGIRTDPVQGAREIQVTLNWFEEIKRLLPP